MVVYVKVITGNVSRWDPMVARKQLSTNFATITATDNGCVICAGDWTRRTVDELSKQINALPPLSTASVMIQGGGIMAMDTAGAWMLHKLFTLFNDQGCEVVVDGLLAEQQHLFQLIQTNSQFPDILHKPSPRWLARVGLATAHKWQQLYQYLSFIGELFSFVLVWLVEPRRVRWRAICRGIETTGYQAIGIVGLLSFLIGVVMAYQMGVQLQDYGANIYVVDGLGVLIFREFGPLITAIIVAGRTGSAFAAQIGTMKLHQEIDALQTFGASALEVLVMPKMLSLLVTLPLLVIFSEIFSLFGGMYMAKTMLGVSYLDFLQRLANSEFISLTTYFVGLVKTPVFAVLIASIGCFQGFRVTNSAESVGFHTTMSVVQSIFMIIIVDAVFSILYSWLGI